MAKSNLLTAVACRNLKTAGLHPDGNGLYLQVSKNGAKSWLFRYRFQGKRPEIGLGSFSNVSLAEAREKAGAARVLLRKGLDPKIHRDDATNESTAPIFMDCARQFLKDKSGEWSNPKHVAQWDSTLKAYVFPVIGKKPVDAVTLDDVLAILRPIWSKKAETASRLRGRIERVLSWAIVKGYREPPNPALWRGNLDMVLPKPSKVKNATHYAALPYKDMPGFWAELQKHDSRTALALRFTILTTARTGEVIAARWEEIDREANIWTIPAQRMKAKKEHRVPLVPEALAVLDALVDSNEYLFPGLKGNPHLSNMAMLAFLKRDLGHPDLTVHGFRSAFKDWAVETTSYPGELSEAQLAHVIANKSQAAYERGDKLERRRDLLTDWSGYLCSNPNVVALQRAG